MAVDTCSDRQVMIEYQSTPVTSLECLRITLVSTTLGMPRAALRLAVRRLIAQGVCLPVDLRPTPEERKDGWTPPTLDALERENHENTVIPHDLVAVSVGLIDGEVYLDLDYVLDSNADVDMNVIKTSDGKYVEVQGTGEESTFSGDELTALLKGADVGLDVLFAFQKETLDGAE